MKASIRSAASGSGWPPTGKYARSPRWRPPRTIARFTLVLHPGHRGEPVPELGGLLVSKVFGRIVHSLFQLGRHLSARAVQKSQRALDVLRVAVGVDHPDARGAAAPDRMQQTGTRAVIEHAVFAGAQAKRLLQHLDRLLDGPGIRVGAEKARAPVARTTVVGDPWKHVVAELKIRIRLVVAKQHVVARCQSLDQVVFQQQGLGLRARHRGLDLRYAR